MRNGKFINCDDCPCFCKMCQNAREAQEKGYWKDGFFPFPPESYEDGNYLELYSYYDKFLGFPDSGDDGVNAGITTWSLPYSWTYGMVWYPSPGRRLSHVFDYREMASKYKRDACYFTVPEVGMDEEGRPMAKMCYMPTYMFVRPDCQLESNYPKDFVFYDYDEPASGYPPTRSYRHYKKFDVNICVDTDTTLYFGCEDWGSHDEALDQFSAYGSDHGDCGENRNIFYLNGVKYNNGTYQFPGYRLCSAVRIYIDDNRDHRNNGYNFSGPHNYSFSFYLPVIYDNESNSGNIQEDDIQ